MGFFISQSSGPDQSALKGTSIEFLHKHQCQVCPLNRQHGLKHPHMPAHGSKHPLVYAIGEGPGKIEDTKGIPFVGPAGRVLRFRIPEHWIDKIRMNNVVRTRPPDNREPTIIEMEACRPSIIADIELTRPQAIFGFGNVPLQWALDQHGITKWNGRWIPIKIGEHICWYFPMLHPSFVMRDRKFEPSDIDSYGSDIEFTFANDLRKAFAMVEKGMPEPVVHTIDEMQSNIEIITDHREAIDLIQSMYDEKVVGLDYETNAFRPYAKNAKILTVGMAGRDIAFAFPLYHRGSNWSDKHLQEVETCFEKFLYEAQCRKIVHNLAFEMEWSAYFFGKEVLRAQPWEDTQSQAYILDERMGGKPGCHSLEFLVIQYLGLNTKEVFDHLDKNNLDKEPLDVVLKYNALDAKAHRMIYFPQAKRLRDEGLMEVYKHQLRRIPTMALTQLKGLPVDQEVVQEFDKQYKKELKEIERQISNLKIVHKFKQLKRADFRPSANQDIKFVVTEILKQHVDNVDEEALSKIDHPICKLVLDWRDVNKNHSTYVKKLHVDYTPEKSDEKTVLWPDKRLHPSISTHSTRTWRTASDAPNEQNYPKRGPNKIVRRQIKDQTLKVVTFDYSGIQARNVAMESKDRKLVDAFWSGYDIHGDWCQRIAKRYKPWLEGGSLKDKEVWGKFRDKAKNKFVFPSFFGAQAKTIAGYLSLPEKIGEEIQEEFWSEFSDVYGWHKRIEENYYKTGYVTGLSGFRRRAPISSNQRINCVDEETECLTKHGWKRWDSLHVGMEIYTKNIKTGEIELKPIFKVNHGYYEGPAYTLSGRLSAVTTPSHKWLVERFIDHGKNNGGHEYFSDLVPSSDLPNFGSGQNRIHMVGLPINQSGGKWTDDEVALIGWILTDGCYVSKTLKRRKIVSYGVNIIQSVTANPGKVKIIDSIFKRLAPNQKPTGTSFAGRKLKPYWRAQRNGVASWIMYTELTNQIYKALPDKTLTPTFLRSLSTVQLSILYNSMLLGDGSWDRQLRSHKSFIAGSKERADAFSMLCVMLGIPHKVCFNKGGGNGKIYKSIGYVIKSKPYWFIRIKKRKLAQPGWHSSWRQFQGIMWCPTTENKTFVARREGIVYITGNSPIQADESIIVCSAMSRLSELGENRFQASMEIHDDLTFFWPKGDIEKNSEIVVKEMTRIEYPWVNVPLGVEVSIGENWCDLEQVAKYTSVEIWGHKRK